MATLEDTLLNISSNLITKLSTIWEASFSKIKIELRWVILGSSGVLLLFSAACFYFLQVLTFILLYKYKPLLQ
jgi:hypothetical protein